VTVVLDTNVLLQALNPQHPLAKILEAWYAGRFVWAVSTDILLEYREVIVRQSGAARWTLLERLLNLASATRGNLLRVDPSFQFLAIPGDRDDDKFADCAITAGADYVITEDAHFQELAGSGYQPQPIAPAAFIGRFLTAQP
jgi:putative PIN family toxin of toxin-antitoxin system